MPWAVDVLAIDVVEASHGLQVIEVNATMEFRNSIAPTGMDIPGAMVEYALAEARRGFDVPSLGGRARGLVGATHV